MRRLIARIWPLVKFLPFALVALCASAAAAPIPIADFAKPPSVESMKLSPDGRYLALVVPQGDYETSLVVLDAITLKAVGGLRSAQYTFVGDLWWVSDERLVIAVAEKFGGLDEPYLTGHLVAVDADGKRVERIYGAMGEMQAGTRLKTRADDTGFATMVDPLPDDPRSAIIAVWPRAQAMPYTELFKIDVIGGSRRKLAKAPVAGADFLVDAEGQPRLAWGTTAEGWHQLYRRIDGDEWVLVNDEQTSGVEIEPLALAADDQAYVQVREAKGPGRVALWHPVNGEIKLLHQPKVAEPRGVLRTADGKRIFAVVTAEDRSDVVLLDDKGLEGRSLAMLRKSFAGQLVLPLSWSRDGSQVLVHVSSDRNSGEYFVFDTQAKKARFLLARDEWAAPDDMQARTPITLKARDGLELHGYLTAPAKRGDALPPLVLLPHGGPHGVRDDGSWDLWSQLLASRGYAVLQVNFRGSGGYGQSFETAGYRQWGGAMINDLIDATRWAIDSGHADGQRACVLGASFGGYAALMSAVREPELFRCAISYVGLSDLALMYQRGDIKDTRYGKNYLKDVIGEDAAQLGEYSPVNHADQIEAAVMLIHGGEDVRVPIDHAERMRAAMKKAGKPVEWLVKDNEAHGFYRQAHRVELYEGVLAFLDKHTAVVE
jgi:dipeptidyl aminopeptidase/acylaminoacyl peptidase